VAALLFYLRKEVINLKDIQVQIIAFNKTERGEKPRYIVVHDTGDPGASAQNEHDYFSGGNRSASADFFVDSDNIIQIIDTDNYYSWHCGDGHGAYGITNGNSLGIEMCLESDGNPSDDTVTNTIDLVKYLMDKYNVDVDHVVRHYDASRKDCPHSFDANNWARWYDFKEQISNSTPEGEWEVQEGKWWYKFSDGSYARDQWLKIEGKWYLFDAQGWMLYDWKSDEDKWYYLGDSNDGSMKTGWIFDKNLGHWYYCNDNGATLTGWQQIDGEWYYLNTDGSMLTGWIKDNNKDYLCYSNGSMAHDCDLYGYHFDINGVATKIS
jgi:N-acetylmuramoyl-L-alanine amidase CwlA